MSKGTVVSWKAVVVFYQDEKEIHRTNVYHEYNSENRELAEKQGNIMQEFIDKVHHNIQGFHGDCIYRVTDIMCVEEVKHDPHTHVKKNCIPKPVPDHTKDSQNKYIVEITHLYKDVCVPYTETTCIQTVEVFSSQSLINVIAIAQEKAYNILFKKAPKGSLSIKNTRIISIEPV